MSISRPAAHSPGSLSKTQLWQWRLGLFFIAVMVKLIFRVWKMLSWALGRRDVWWGFRCLRRCRSNSELSRRLKTASFCRCGSNGKLWTLFLMGYCFPWKPHKNTITIKFYFCFYLSAMPAPILSALCEEGITFIYNKSEVAFKKVIWTWNHICQIPMNISSVNHAEQDLSAYHCGDGAPVASGNTKRR